MLNFNIPKQSFTKALNAEEKKRQQSINKNLKENKKTKIGDNTKKKRNKA